MEIIRKILDIILLFFTRDKEKKLEEEAEVQLQVQQEQIVAEKVRKRVRKIIKTPQDDNFFGD